ncbi:MAG: hypothetical protein BRD41_05775 [Bacteroidetes bacterium QS_1_63_11]|nr:MAG: hypothetical protein BRD41_05775 [Bacteroidetes bacterium QS_1_63_11]
MVQQSDSNTLRRSLARRLQERAELEQQVRAAQSQFEAEVVPLQEEVLRLQMERLKKAAQARMRSAKLRNAYHDAQNAYETFREQRSGSPQVRSASTENMKATYWRATKHCHPDIVADPYHEEAAATFQALESAYNADHSEAVEAIAEVLDTWGFPQAPDAPEQRYTTAALRRAVSTVEASIERLRTSEVYQALTEAGDVDLEAVVEAQKRALRERLAELRQKPRSRPHAG